MGKVVFVSNYKSGVGITALIYLVTYLIFDSSSDVTEMKKSIEG